MALVGKFVEQLRDSGRVHPTRTDCRYSVYRADGRTLLQLDTYGSTSREMPEKLSQTLQIDEAGARRLVEIIRATFPGIK